MKHTLLYSILLAVLLAGCNGQATSTVSHGGAVSDYVSLIDNLRGAGASVEPAGEIEQPFFSVSGQVITVNGADVQVFEYADAAAAEAEAALISPDGRSVGTSMVMWVATPHFFSVERLIVLYVGDDVQVLETLGAALGPQFGKDDTNSVLPEDERPPLASLNIEGREQISSIGTYCWTQPGSNVGVCADFFSISTPEEPLRATSPLTAQFEWGLEQPPASLRLTVIVVTEQDETDQSFEGTRVWELMQGEDYTLSLERRPQIELTLESGLYVFRVSAIWQDLGSVSYGFLVEVE